MADLLRLLTGELAGVLVAGVALLLPGDARAEPTFLLGTPDPCPSCDTVTFDSGGLSRGTPVTTQFAAEGLTFQNVRYTDGSLGQSIAPGFSGGGLVNDSGAAIFIDFAGPQQFAAFAYADSGWDPCCEPRTLSAYLGGQLIASTDLPLRPAQFLTVPALYPMKSAADAAYALAADKTAAQSSAVQIQGATVAADQSRLDTAVQAVSAAATTFELDYARYVACGDNYICQAIYLAFLVSDAVDLSDAEDRANAAAAQLQTDQAQLAVLQEQYQADQAALADALNAKNAADALYAQALADEPGPGFIGFAGTPFDSLVLSGLHGLGDSSITTVIDTLEMAAPEPPTIASLSVALAVLAFLCRTRRRVPARC